MSNGALLSFVCKSDEPMRLGRISAIGRDKRRDVGADDTAQRLAVAVDSAMINADLIANYRLQTSDCHSVSM